MNKQNILLMFLLYGIYNVSIGYTQERDISYLHEPYLLVSLGTSCWTGSLLSHFSIRKMAFPFDWIESYSNLQLIECLDNDFKFFNNTSYFNLYPHADSIFFTNYYGFNFLHDWPHNTHEKVPEKNVYQLNLIQDKYERRINRFKSLRHYKGKLFFIRYFQTHPYNHQASWQWNSLTIHALQQALKRFLPETDFKLIILSYTDHPLTENTIENVIEYIIPQTHHTQTYTHAHFESYRPIISELLHSCSHLS